MGTTCSANPSHGPDRYIFLSNGGKIVVFEVTKLTAPLFVERDAQSHVIHTRNLHLSLSGLIDN